MLRIAFGDGDRPPQHARDRLTRHAAQPQDDRLVPGHVDDGRLEADSRCSAVEDHRHATAQVRLHVRRRRRADVAGQIGAGCGDGAIDGAQQGLRNGVARDADRDGVEPGGRQVGDRTIRPLGQHQRQRPRPKSCRQLPAEVGEMAELLRRRDVRHMHDQRVELWPALGREDRRHGATIGGVGAEPVHGLGRKRDQGCRPAEFRGGLAIAALLASITAIAADPALARELTLPERQPSA